MMVAVRELLGIGQIPSDRSAASSWLQRHDIKVETANKRGGKFHVVALVDLPAATRRAYIERRAELTGLPMGAYDDTAHNEFLQAPVTMRSEAERKAAIACLLVSILDTATWSERIALTQKKFGVKGTSKPSLKRLLRTVNGVDPVNFAPSLLASYNGTSKKADLSDKAWSFFMTILRDAAPTFPITRAYADVRDVAPLKGWQWPSYSSVYRRWNALPEAQRLAARHGGKETAKRLTQPVIRDKTTILPMQSVSLDGRTQDYWTDLGDGKPVRLTMIALIDVASNLILGYELAVSENAVATARVIRTTCERHGIFDTLYTDNGSAFAGHLVAGGTDHKFRNAATNKGIRPIGICKILGINTKFALPGNAQAKIAERTFATLSRSLDDRPEFKGAHAGHSPGASPNAGVVPVPLQTVERIVAREVSRYNLLEGRRSQGARGRSYQAIFDHGTQDRIPRRPTSRQLYLASLVYRPVAVDRDGRVKANGWVYGSHTTQQDLLPYHGKEKVLLGRDPEDLAAPAIAFDQAGNLICEDIQPVRQGRYDSVDGIRDAARNRKVARQATADAEAANTYLSDTELQTALAALDSPSSAVTVPDKTVIGGHFGSPLKSRKVTAKPEPVSHIRQEYLDNFDRAIGLELSRK